MATLKDKTKAKATAKVKPKKASGDPNATVLDNAYADLLDAIDKALNLGGDMHRYRLSTGILSFDLCIGGGLVPGMTVVAGGEGSGKSTAAMHVIKAALDAKIPIIKYKDPEGSVDPDYTGKILHVISLDDVFGKKLDGKWIKLPKARYSDDNSMSSAFDDMVHTVNRLPDKRYVSDRKQWFYVIDSRDKKTDRFKQAFGKPDHKLSNGGKLWFPTDNPNPQAVFIIDSGPLLSPDNVEEGEQTNDSLALQAREYSKQFPRIMGKLRRKCVVIFMVNQLRTAPMVKYGSPLYEPCGTAFGFNTSVRMWISQRAVPPEWKHDKKVSSHSEEPSVEGDGADHYQYKYIKNKKNKSATPFLECWIRVWVRDRKGKGRGIDPAWDVFQFLTTTGLASRGKKNAVEFIKQEGRLKPLSGKTLSWLEFKLLVLSETENNKLLTENGLKLRKRFKLDGKFHIRKLCNKMMRNGEAATLMNNLINRTSSGEAAEVEDLEDDDF